MPPRDHTGRQNVVIFDWDDTLFPTTALKLQQAEMTALRSVDIAKIEAEMALLQVSLSELLQEALELAPGTTYIVTNAGEGWVSECTNRFLPDLKALLDGSVRVISARQYFCDHYSGGTQQTLPAQPTAEDCLRWKAFTFASLAMEHGGLSPSGHPLSVVSYGDAPTDASATRFLRRFLPKGTWVKTVQLLSVPTIPQVKDQLDLMRTSLATVCRHGASATLCVGRRAESPKAAPAAAPLGEQHIMEGPLATVCL